MESFVGRKEPLSKLKGLLNRKSASLVVIRGRRRIGKSRLVAEFSKDLPFYQFTGLAPTEGTNAQKQREEFARQLRTQMGLPPLKADDWGDLFEAVASQTKSGRYVVLFDEISWMGSKDPTFLNKLKIAWDTHFEKNPELILVLCGSVSSWIEKNIMSSTSFFGRITHKISLDELALKSCNELLEVQGFKRSAIEKLTLLSLTGGVPWYLKLIDPKLSANQNIHDLCFTPDGILFCEFDRIFHDLFGKKSALYKEIVQSIIDGSASHKEIACATGYSRSGMLSTYLNDLVLSGYLRKDRTWSIKTGKQSALCKYRLSDNFVRFYVRYISPRKSRIEQGNLKDISLASLPGWHTMIGLQFENLVLKNRALIHQELKLDPAEIINEGPFFQRPTTRHPGCQIDYMIQTRYNTLYVIEIKFSIDSLSKVPAEEVEKKISRLDLPKGHACIPVLVYANSKSECLEKSEFFVHTVDFTKLLTDES